MQSERFLEKNNWMLCCDFYLFIYLFICVFSSLFPAHFNLRHVYSLLHHFSEWRKNKRSFFFFLKTFQLTSVLFLTSFSLLCHQRDAELCRLFHFSSEMLKLRRLGGVCVAIPINFISSGQVFTVIDSPWKLCLWWLQTTDSPSFLTPFTPEHKRSICWADGTKNHKRQVNKMNQEDVFYPQQPYYYRVLQ